MSRKTLLVCLCLCLVGCVLPEERTILVREPSQLPTVPIPEVPPPITVREPQQPTTDYEISLDEAIRIALANTKVVRILGGLTAQGIGRTIYDTAITFQSIEEQKAQFDPIVSFNSAWGRTENPQAQPDPFNPLMTFITGTRIDDYRSDVGVEQRNPLGGQFQLRWVENPTRFSDGLRQFPFPLNPQNRSLLELSYTQPLLQGAGLAVNLAPIVLARIDTERSFFQYKDSVQELVRGVIEAYWSLVQARVDVWARQIQVEQSKEAYDREQARLKAGFADLGAVAQARVTYNRFRSGLIAAQAAVLAREGVLRNILFLSPNDGRRLIPVSAPTSKRARVDWDALRKLIEQRRPDIVELKLILEADQQQLLLAENQTLPRLDLVGLYRWNGLSGEMPTGQYISSGHGAYTDYTVGVNFSVPLGLRAARARVRQRSLLIVRDQANLQQGLHAALAEVSATVRDLDSAYEQYEALKETRAAAAINLRVQIEQFRTRRNIYLNVLQALNDFGDAVSAEAAALISYNISLATLERQSGTILEAHGVVFNEERFGAAGPLGKHHPREYPAALPPSGDPKLYPSTGKPGENAFDLQKPAIPRSDPEAEPKEELLPPPRILPLPK